MANSNQPVSFPASPTLDAIEEPVYERARQALDLIGVELALWARSNGKTANEIRRIDQALRELVFSVRNQPTYDTRQFSARQIERSLQRADLNVAFRTRVNAVNSIALLSERRAFFQNASTADIPLA